MKKRNPKVSVLKISGKGKKQFPLKMFMNLLNLKRKLSF
jgi:hypothetical protein